MFPLFKALTEFDQISVVIKDVEIADTKSPKHRRFTSKACAFIAQHFFCRVKILHAKREVDDSLNFMLWTRLLPRERVLARSFDLDQLNSKSLVFQDGNSELHLW